MLGDYAEVVHAPGGEQVTCGRAWGGAGLGVGGADALLPQSVDAGRHLARVKLVTRGGGVGGGGGSPRGRAAGDALVASEPAEAVEDLVRVEVVTPRQRLGQVGGGRGRGGGWVTQRPLRPQARQGGGELVRRGGAVTVRLA